jgi:uncharacterized Fe-S cluster protein YjdI
VFTPGFVFFVGSVLPFPRNCVHSRFCFLGGGLSYPSRGSVFTPGFVFLVGSVFPFSMTCVHSGFCFLGGGLSYPLRGPVFTPGFVFLVGSVLLMVIVFCVVLFAMFDFVLYFMSNLVCILD